MSVHTVAGTKYKQGTHRQLMKTTQEGGITWTRRQNENDAERRESIHSQTHFSANDGKQ
jgi:hypothetical protein